MKTLSAKESQAYWTAERCACANALRDYEAAHRAWMQSSVFYPVAHAKAKARMDEARKVYTAAWEAANPGGICF